MRKIEKSKKTTKRFDILKKWRMVCALAEKSKQKTISEHQSTINSEKQDKGVLNMSEAITTIAEQGNEVVSNRIDFLVYVSSKNGNPNGDPDNGNAPRIDTATQKGVITDGGIKSRTRQAVKRIYGEPIMIDKENVSIENAVSKVGDSKDVSSELSKHYWDVKTFGGVFGKKGSPVTGPVQISMGTSLHPISIQQLSITRCIPNDVKANKNGVEESNSQFGDKAYQTYGLYRFSGEINPYQAKKTGFTNDDVKKLFDGISKAYSLWTSAQKGETETVKIIVFKHNSPLGCAKKHVLFGCVQEKLRDGVEVPTDYSDYEISIDESKIPAGVTVEVID